MSALLSPAKPVRTRFKVPGEGAYELYADFAPPNPSRIFSPSSTTSLSSGTPSSSNPPATTPATASTPSTSQRAPSNPPSSSTTNPSAFAGGPLGLPKVTKISFVQDASLDHPCRQNHNLLSQPTDYSSAEHDLNFSTTTSVNGHPTTSQTPQLPANTPPTSSTTSSSIFSFRKLTGLGSTISSKFSSSTDAPSEEPQNTPPTASAPLIPPRIDHDGTVPRAPPRIALPVGNMKSIPLIGRDNGPTPSQSALSETEALLSALDIHTPVEPAVDKPYGVLAYNAADSLILLDMASHTDSQNGSHAQVSLTLHSRSPPTAHVLHSTPEALKLLVGCVNGEVIFYPDIQAATAATLAADIGKKSRTVSAVASLASVAVASVMSGSSCTTTPQHFVFNKDGGMNSSRVVSVRWVPGSASRIVSVHADGMMIVYDTRFKPSSGSLRGAVSSASSAVIGHESSNEFSAPGTIYGGSTPSVTGRASPRGTADRPNGDKFRERADSQKEREREKSGLSAGSGDKPTAPAVGRRNGSSATTGNTLGQHEIIVNRAVKGKRNNPVAFWQVGRSAITSCEFSPSSGDCTLLAITGRDGYLRILDFTREVALMAFRSYFGGFLCVSWSPDGKYVATGGEDDLVSIWCPAEERLVARLEGHTSWVSAVAWDGYLGGKRRYRVGSAGQDAKLLLWDFALDMLHHRSSQSRLSSGVVRLRSYARESNSNSTTGSTVSSGGTAAANGVSGAQSVERRTGKLARLRGHSSTTVQPESEVGTSYATPTCASVIVSALGRAEVPIVEPAMAHVAHGEPLTDVWFQENGVFTADCVGSVKMWSRPPHHSVPELNISTKTGAGLAGGERRAAGDLD